MIVYLAKELLIAPGTETRDNTRAVRFLEAHEMGHQWFGDMVTQADWNDVWLSEAFATWISEKMMDQEDGRPRGRICPRSPHGNASWEWTRLPKLIRFDWT